MIIDECREKSRFVSKGEVTLNGVKIPYDTVCEDNFFVNEDGKPVPTFERLSDVRAQIQSENDAALFHADMAGANTITRKIYLYSPKGAALQPASLFRPLSRSGDYIVQEDGTVWMVNAVIENFAGVGWVSVRATLQVKPPEGVEWL